MDYAKLLIGRACRPPPTLTAKQLEETQGMRSKGAVRIGSGAGTSDDRLVPALELAERGDIDYLVFECLAERTVSRENLSRSKDPDQGYSPSLHARLRMVLPTCIGKGIRIVNRGPGSGARRLLDRELCRAGLAPASVRGYDRIARGHLDVARALINEGADVNAKDFTQDTPFLVASAEGRAEILKLILGAQPDLRSVNRFGDTALIPACHRGHVETVKLLLTTAIDKDQVNHVGLTALMEAVVLGDGGPRYIEVVRLLVQAGAGANSSDRDGITALAHARRRGYEAIAHILEAAGAR